MLFEGKGLGEDYFNSRFLLSRHKESLSHA
jgi:hypothetical protein